ncbi:MAG: hypothetical protein LBH79_00740 [Nitrososphaerota archaeon]|jgi:hypothetical protein|nr:hypothetical protein [Nitrososphaerota archaeon]
MSPQETIMQLIDQQQKQQREMIIQIIREVQQTPKFSKTLRRRKTEENNDSADFKPNEIRTTLKTANRINEPTYINSEKKPSKGLHAKKFNTIESAKHRKQLQSSYLNTGRNLQILTAERDGLLNEKMSLIRRAEKIDQEAKNVQKLGDSLNRLEFEYKKLHFWNWIRKPKLEKAIRQAEIDYRSALYYFGKEHHINPRDIPEKITQIQEKIQSLESKITKKIAQISTLAEKQRVIKLEYDTHPFRISKKARQSPDYSIDPSNITGLRQSVMGFMLELRKDAEEQTRRKHEREQIMAIKPKRMLMIASPMQKKRSLAAVIGKRYRRTTEDARPISSLPNKKNHV